MYYIMESELNDRVSEISQKIGTERDKAKIAAMLKRMKDDTKEYVNRAYETKPIDSYPENVIFEMDILTVDKETNDTHPIGSLSYRGTKYAGDYDFFEEINKGGREETIIFFVENLKRMVSEYIKLKDHYFIEIKCGIDARYNLDIGVCQNGVYYMSDTFHNDIIELYKNKLLPKSEYNLIMEVIKRNSKTQDDYEKIQKLLRSHRVLRWTAEEILNGERKIPYGIKTLYDACQDIEKINIETIAILNNKISDVSNFYYLTYTDNGKLYTINMEQSQIDDPDSFRQGLLGSINMLLYSKMDYNPLKAIKRYFSLARNTGDMALRTKLQPVMNSETFELGKIKSELITIAKTLEKYKNKISSNIVISQMDDIKFRMATLLKLSDEMLEEFNKKIGALDDNYNVNNVIELCRDIAHSLEPLLNESALNFLTLYGLYPTPPLYTPNNPQYRII